MRCVYLAAVVTLGSLSMSPWALAEGDAAAGQSKSATCTACHGADGNSISPEWPSLAGQHPAYIVSQLKAFKDGARQNVLMSPMSLGLSEQDMMDLAAYYAGQPVNATAAPANLAERGLQLYRSGDVDKQVSACASCHGPSGRGNAPAQIPSISGQRSAYTVLQLKAYASGARTAASEAKTAMMQLVAERLSDEDMAAVAAYAQALK